MAEENGQPAMLGNIIRTRGSRLRWQSLKKFSTDHHISRINNVRNVKDDHEKGEYAKEFTKRVKDRETM